MSPRQTVPAPGGGGNEQRARLVENAWVELPDGVRLAVRLWLPEGAETRPVSAILDSVPYRKSDGTAVRDAAWGGYFAARGFAYARVDLRGSGDSTGILQDEYTEQEQLDVEAVIAWLAGRPWCTGAIGMIGISWGGFAALQMAARDPEALRGVVAIHASDDRYADDVHYVGGCVLATDMAHWATSMLAYLNQPPDPDVVGEGWRKAWTERLDRARPFIEPWLAHQRRDGYWRQGSACERYDAIRCPVFAVGGWSDGYRDMVLRLVEHVRAPVRGLIGPWGHTTPERGAPGPAIGFLQECVRFFAASLNGADNGFFKEPRLITYMQEAVPPRGSYLERPGRWVAEESWPSPAVEVWTQGVGRRSLGEPAASAEGSARTPVAEVGSVSCQTGEAGASARTVCSPQATGIDGGVWCGDGGPADLALDQRADDGASLCWDSEPLRDRVELLGKGEAELELEVDRPWALVAVRVCDVAPDGTSALIARGLLNLSRREGHERTVPMPVGEPVHVRVPLASTAYAIPAGHRLRLAVSNTYWPMAWPSPEPARLTVHCSGRSRLSLPRRRPSGFDAQMRPFEAPETGTALACETTMRRDGGRHVHRNLATGASELRFEWQGSRTRIVSTNTEMGEQNAATYRIVEGDPLSATVDCRVEVTLARPGWTTRVLATSTMTCDAECFRVTSALEAYDGEVRIRARTFEHRFARDGV